jgi:hypothetical protein
MLHADKRGLTQKVRADVSKTACLRTLLLLFDHYFFLRKFAATIVPPLYIRKAAPSSSVIKCSANFPIFTIRSYNQTLWILQLGLSLIRYHPLDIPTTIHRLQRINLERLLLRIAICEEMKYFREEMYLTGICIDR